MKRQIRKDVEELKNHEVEESPLGFLITNVSKAYTAYLKDCLEELGLSNYQIYYLIALESSNNVTQEYIANKLNLSEGNVTKLTKSLIKLELVERKQNTEDRRKKNLTITEKGLSIVNQFHSAIEGLNSDLMEDFTEEEFFILRILLKKMFAVLNKK